MPEKSEAGSPLFGEAALSPLRPMSSGSAGRLALPVGRDDGLHADGIVDEFEEV